MQTFRLQRPDPDRSTNVTRLWIAPGLVRIGAVLGSTIQDNGAALCWDVAAQRVLWETTLLGLEEALPDPDFDREVTRVVYPISDESDPTSAPHEYLGLCDVTNDLEERLGKPHPYRPVMTRDGRYVLAFTSDATTRRRDLRRWGIPSDLGTRDGASGRAGEIGPDRGWAIRIQEVKGRIQQQIDNAPSVLGVSPNGKRVACGRYNGAVTVWSLTSRREVAAIPPLKRPGFSRFWVQRLTFSSDGSRLAVLRRRLHRRLGFEVSVWAIPQGGREKGPTEKVSVNDAVFSPDGRALLTAREDGKVGVWDVATWKLRQEYAWKIGELFSVAFSPDGLTCAAGGEKGQVVVWDVDS